MNRYDKDIGKIHTTEWYADEEMNAGEVSFSVPASRWNEFLKSDLFHELEEYVDSLEIQDTHTHSHERKRKEEIEGNMKKNGKIFSTITEWWMRQGRFSEERILSRIKLIGYLVISTFILQATTIILLLFLL